MSTRQRFFAALISFMLFSYFCAGAGADKAIKLARAKAGEIIRCSPSGAEDGLSLLDALSKLKKGKILFLMPGEYPSEILITVDGVIIEGEPGKRIASCINVKSNDCIVRNVWAKELRSNNSITVVDSIIEYFYTFDDSRAELNFDNCCFRAFCIGYYNKKVLLKKCTLSNKDSVGISIYGGQLFIEKCVVFSQGKALVFTSHNKAKLRIQDSNIYGAECLAFHESSSKASATVEDIKKICGGFTKSGTVTIDKPIFKKEPRKILNTEIPETVTIDKPMPQKESHQIPDTEINGESGDRVELANFILKDDSTAKKQGWGASLSKDGYPVMEE